jgi:hypothetical protein
MPLKIAGLYILNARDQKLDLEAGLLNKLRANKRTNLAGLYIGTMNRQYLFLVQPSLRYDAY